MKQAWSWPPCQHRGWSLRLRRSSSETYEMASAGWLGRAPGCLSRSTPYYTAATPLPLGNPDTSERAWSEPFLDGRDTASRTAAAALSCHAAPPRLAGCHRCRPRGPVRPTQVRDRTITLLELSPTHPWHRSNQLALSRPRWTVGTPGIYASCQGQGTRRRRNRTGTDARQTWPGGGDPSSFAPEWVGGWDAI